MEVRGRERVGFNFIDLLKSFVSSNNGVIDDDLEKQLNEIIKEQDSSLISKLEKNTNPVKSAKGKKGGTRRKKGGLDVQTVETKQIKSRTNTSKEAGEKERE